MMEGFPQKIILIYLVAKQITARNFSITAIATNSANPKLFVIFQCYHMYYQIVDLYFIFVRQNICKLNEKLPNPFDTCSESYYHCIEDDITGRNRWSKKICDDGMVFLEDKCEGLSFEGRFLKSRVTRWPFSNHPSGQCVANIETIQSLPYTSQTLFGLPEILVFTRSVYT